ncbi:MAG TPA: CerR family C-terminal domain-containing protein [Candidatus Polarisedimenticolaceae bacterium]|nr:CerR family C-terminal domain-containing protein [Candidatus Polarisedimenticolaceae bacterium]
MGDATPRTDLRSEATRSALIRSAIDAYGRAGFHGTTTRAIARAAAVNQAAIAYHFGGKAGLYHASIEHIAERIGGFLGAVTIEAHRQLDHLAASEPDEPTLRHGCLEVAGRLTDALARMLTGEESESWARLIVREQQDPTESFDLLQGVVGPWAAALIRVFESAGGQTPAEARLSVLTIVGQALVFRVSRTSVLRITGWKQIGERELAAIQRRIRQNVRAVLVR